MSRPREYLVAFVGSLWLHVLAAVLFTRWSPQPAGVIPLFRQGVSALALTVLPPPSPSETPPVVPEERRPVSPLIQPPPPSEPIPSPPLEAPVPDEPALLPEIPMPLIASAAGTSEAPAESPSETPTEGAPVPPEPAAGGEEGDHLEKGVEMLTALDVSVRPRYPLGSRLRGEEGTVLLRVKVNAAGRAEKIVTVSSSGFPALDRAARSALLKATFRPRVGRASPAGEFLISIRFQLVD